MKRIALVLLVATALAAGRLDAQAVSATQVRKKTNGGLTGDAANALAVGIYRGTVAPATPVTGQLWMDTNTTPAILKEYTGASWATPVMSTAITQADLSSFPATPTDGMIIWVRATKRAVIYDATAATWYFLDGTNRSAESSYSLETAGYPNTFIGGGVSISAAKAAGGSMTLGAHTCVVNYYNSTGGDTDVRGTSNEIVITAGDQTMDLTFTANPSGAVGKRIWCSKAGTAAPLYLVTSIDDAVTNTYSVTVADTAFLNATPPDVDFSADLPAALNSMNLDRTKGGCGSTGSSVICAMYYGVDGIGGWGAGAYYHTTATTAWRARWRVKRLLHIFQAGTVACGTGAGYNTSLGLAMERIDITNPTSRAVVAVRGNSGCFLPPNALGTLETQGAKRTAGAAWDSAMSEAAPWPPISTVPFYVQVTQAPYGAQYAYAFGVSQDGVNWNVAPRPTIGSAQNICSGMDCGPDRLPYVGFGAYRWASSNGVAALIEVDQFTWENM